MLKPNIFNVLIVIALVIVVALTAREAFATTIITDRPDTTLSCKDLPSHFSLRTERIEQTGTLLPYTEDGPTGVDGGLMDLLSKYRTCSR
jgi:hypothetical protein